MAKPHWEFSESAAVGQNNLPDRPQDSGPAPLTDMQRSKLRNETDVHNSFYRTLELVKTRNRMESERLRTLLDSHIEKHKQYELRTMCRAEEIMRRRLEDNARRRRELSQQAVRDRAEDDRLSRFREAARARKSFIDFLIEHVRNKEVRTPVDDADEPEGVDEEEDEEEGATAEKALKTAKAAERKKLAKTREEFARRMAELNVNHPTALMRETVVRFGGKAKPKPLRSQIGSFSLQRVEERRHDADRKKSVFETGEEAYKVVKILNDQQELQRQLAEAGKADYLRVQPIREEQEDATLPVRRKEQP